MKFNIEKSELMNGLAIVQKALGKCSMPILNGISIETDKDKIILKGSDMITTMITTCNATIEEEGGAVIDNKILSDMKKFADGIMKFTLGEDGVLTIQSGRTKAKLPILGLNKDYPKINLLNEDDALKMETETFKEMVQGTSYAVAKDETRPILTGVLLQHVDGEFNMAALDGYRLSVQTRSVTLDKNFALVVPVKPLVELTKIITGDQLLMSYDDRNIMFKFDNTIIQTRLLEGNYVKYSSLIPQDNDILLEVDSEELKETITRCLIVNKEKNLVVLSLTEKNLTIKSSDPTFGEVEDTLECVSNKELEIAFNGAYLLDVCNHNKGTLKLSFKNNISPCVIKNEDDNGLSLVLPVRMLKR